MKRAAYIIYNKTSFSSRLTKEKDWGQKLDQRSKWSLEVLKLVSEKTSKQETSRKMLKNFIYVSGLYMNSVS